MSCYFSNGITDLVPDGAIGFVDEGLEELSPYDSCLILGQGDEHIHVFTPLVFAHFGSYPAEDDRRE